MTRPALTSFIAAGVFGLASFGTITLAQEGKLKCGDSAPPLAVSAWLHGPEIKGFEPGHVYVVEFWATWCGPCIQIMPHMGDLQDEYRNKGVTFIGIASEANDKEPKVRAFVATHGPKLGYTFAFDSGSETHTAYMKASGQNGIPCTFVVDRQGKIAYIGHPFFLDFVLPKVLDGTWDMKANAQTIATADKEFDAAYAVMMTRRTAPSRARGHGKVRCQVAFVCEQRVHDAGETRAARARETVSRGERTCREADRQSRPPRRHIRPAPDFDRTSE